MKLHLVTLSVTNEKMNQSHTSASYSYFISILGRPFRSANLYFHIKKIKFKYMYLSKTVVMLTIKACLLHLMYFVSFHDSYWQ